MNDRRLVGIDLGIASAHTVRVLDGDGNDRGQRKAWPTVESLDRGREGGAGRGAQRAPGWRWWWSRPGRRGCRSRCSSAPAGTSCYRVSSAKAADLRRFLSRHTKTNGIDADTLARLPLFDPPGCTRWSCPAPSGRRWTAGCGPATGSPRPAACHKRRIKDLVRQLLPMTPADRRARRQPTWRCWNATPTRTRLLAAGP